MGQEIKKLYSKYFQKSRSFLLPILDIKKDTLYPPIQSYLQLEGVCTIQDYKLILLYYKQETTEWHQFLANTLMTNGMFSEYYDIDDSTIALSFDMSMMAEEYDKVINGTYSKLDKITKIKIKNFYGEQSPEWTYMDSFLHPNNYIFAYSQMLDVSIDSINITGELCDKPDLTKETLKKHETNNDADSISLGQKENI